MIENSKNFCDTTGLEPVSTSKCGDAMPIEGHVKITLTKFFKICVCNSTDFFLHCVFFVSTVSDNFSPVYFLKSLHNLLKSRVHIKMYIIRAVIQT